MGSFEAAAAEHIWWTGWSGWRVCWECAWRSAETAGPEYREPAFIHPTTHRLIIASKLIGAYECRLRSVLRQDCSEWFAFTRRVHLEIADGGVSIVAWSERSATNTSAPDPDAKGEQGGR